jgi:hypothetical protein
MSVAANTFHHRVLDIEGRAVGEHCKEKQRKWQLETTALFREQCRISPPARTHTHMKSSSMADPKAA